MAKNLTRAAGASEPGGEHLPRIARLAVQTVLSVSGQEPPRVGHGYLAERRAVFVTLRFQSGELRGCVGTLVPQRRDVVEETWHVAQDAAFRDTRFAPVTCVELVELAFEVNVLHALETVASLAELDPQCFGVVVRAKDGRRGALLPGIPEITTVEHQLKLARKKAGIRPWERVEIDRFRVDKFCERPTD
jgi:AmmeMemoRadiSam system protein A